MLFDKLHVLPDDILSIILKKIVPEQLIFINREFYIRFNYLIDNMIITRFDSYVRDMIRNHCTFVFSQLINRQYSRWILRQNYHYDNHIYRNYVYFLLSLCRQYNSIKCYNLLSVKFDGSIRDKYCKTKQRHWIK